MNQNEPGKPRLEQLPYYREYVEQILRPRVVRLVEEVRANLGDRVWAELLALMAEDQQPGSSGDQATLESLRSMLEGTLGLRLSVQMNTEFVGGSVESAPGGGGAVGSAGSGGAGAPTANADGRHNVDVVNHKIPDNPLVRSVMGIRKAVK